VQITPAGVAIYSRIPNKVNAQKTVGAATPELRQPANRTTYLWQGSAIDQIQADAAEESPLNSSWEVHMQNLQLLAVVAAIVLPVGNASDAPLDNSKAYVPPVMREAGTAPTAIFTLPLPPKILGGPPPVLRHAAPVYPAEFVKDSSAYLESRLDRWRQPDAAGLLGASLRQRPSVDDDGKANGMIYAYSDPLRRYREFEPDFEGDSGKLRSIFVYPLKMSWRDCRRVYGSGVFTSLVGGGRTFYSYRNRRLDVLVDASGSVISLGIY
jgi:hypothetical protein